MRALVAVGVLAAMLTPSFARAQPSSDEAKAQAVQLFDEAEQLAASGRFAEACPKYAESHRLDPQLGVLLYLAECYEKNGQLASAWGSFRAATEVAEQRGDARATVARSRAEALAPRLSRLTIDVPAAARVPGLVVSRGGSKVAEPLFGTAVAVDPGKHRITAEAPGYEPWSAEVNVAGEGTQTIIRVKELVQNPTPASTPAQGSAEASPSSEGSTERIAAIALGGLGLVGIGVGGFFGLSAQSAHSDSNALCNANNVCTEEGTELRETAKDRALVASIATGAGAAALVGASVLWFTAPSPNQKSARRAPSRARPALEHRRLARSSERRPRNRRTVLTAVLRRVRSRRLDRSAPTGCGKGAPPCSLSTMRWRCGQGQM